MTAHTYGWADLDTANRTHYGRGKPADLLDAERELSRAQRNLDEATDWYFEAAYGDPLAKAQLDQASADYKRIHEHYMALAVKYHQRKASDFDPHENYPEPKF